ncbi:hypothetical protein M406DRAFT_60979 [Cryphonectria parasitica EP155]|uniref:Thiaminase-2/PQQC domain-containing protein n=1 Tax=Cryphonectria parasitica (strain ATCC 38755 / EP155) TaxID=660469 RepID=A0A9P4Y553_CRYP1|nr:uncharacterized protein M406DRAFT_60979 [Cryphonectria parasitica EP155]KAF3766861.1 hypothetical protein M406DRAFT_60979 [Cryphonectria parasitica EP155]
MASICTWSLTTHLLSLDEPQYKAATQHRFLKAAGEGRVPTDTLGKWLANDRLYIHAYIKAVGRILALVDLPQTTTPLGAHGEAAAPETQLIDWLIESLAGLRREERFFVEMARKYGITIDLETETVTRVAGRDIQQVVPDGAKLPGLVLFEGLFSSVGLPPPVLSWLEAAVVFWGTEKVYSEAWGWARSHQQEMNDNVAAAAAASSSSLQDADGGALRTEFIPNWANQGFVNFVQQLAGIIDSAVSKAVDVLGDDVKTSLVRRAEGVWRELLVAEEAFWPDV